MTLLGLVVVVVDLRSKLLFLDDGLLLVLARLARLLSCLVLELAVVHDLADRWSGVGSDFDKVEIGVGSDAKGVLDAHDADLLAAGSDQSDFWNSDALVDAGLSGDGASLVRVSVSCEPIGESGFRRQRAGSRCQQPVRKGPANAGPDADRSRLAPSARYAEPAPRGAGDRTAVPVWPTVGARLHLLSRTRRNGRAASLAGMTDRRTSATWPTYPPSRSSAARP